MKYGMQHKINRDHIICETKSAIETLCAFAGYLVAHVPTDKAEFERTMWCMVELPKGKPIRFHKPLIKHRQVEVNVCNQHLDMLSHAYSMYEACMAGYVRGVDI
jgi:hypothetical protein